MGLDTKYRPKSYSEVLGQEATITILRELAKRGQGYRQSYCFSGPFGTGKTTLAKLFAKSLLCDSPVDGEACNVCSSCVLLNTGKSHPDVTEVDAASNSRKEDMERILEEVKHSSFTGKHRIYIIDEAHELSKAAQDALLLPLENTLPNSEDKRLVCIFCTTEPSKMRSAILSRCAPSFSVTLVEPKRIAERLSFVCDREGFDYDQDALILLAEICESHVRDCLKAIESLQTMGKITRERVLEFMQLSQSERILDVLLALDSEDFSLVVDQVEFLTQKVSASFLYKKMAEYTLLAFRGNNFPSYLNREKMENLHEKKITLLKWAKVFSSKPYNVDKYVLICDLHLCNEIARGITYSSHNSFMVSGSGSMKAEISGMGIFVNPSARKSQTSEKTSTSSSVGGKKELSTDEFKSSLEAALEGK